MCEVGTRLVAQLVVAPRVVLGRRGDLHERQLRVGLEVGRQLLVGMGMRMRVTHPQPVPRRAANRDRRAR